MESDNSAFSQLNIDDGGETDSKSKNKTSPQNVSRHLSVNMADTYLKCNPNMKMVEKPPQRVLTVPPEPHPNPDSYDNKEANLICRTQDRVIGANGEEYIIIDLLGTGTFGQVFRCVRVRDNTYFALKIVKNKPAYRNQGLLEIKIATLLNETYDKENKNHIVRIVDSFTFREHVCLLFELLGMSVLDVLTHNQYRGLPLNVVRKYAQQLLKAFVVLEEAKVIHCDLKPENILVASSVTEPDQKVTSLDIKLIDLGSACFEGKTMYSYIQSRFYRSPEVLLGFPYSRAIDMWSLGCVCTEVYLGLPLFPGVSPHNQLSRIVDMFGPPPDYLIDLGKHGKSYFQRKLYHSKYAKLALLPHKSVTSLYLSKFKKNEEEVANTPSEVVPGDKEKEPAASGTGGVKGMFKSFKLAMFSKKSEAVVSNSSHEEPGSENKARNPSQPVKEVRTPSSVHVIKTAEEYARDTNTEAPVLKKYLRYQFLDDVIMKCPVPNKASMTQEQKTAELELRRCFLDFLYGLFNMDPKKRWTPTQAAKHPFITGEEFTELYVPEPVVKATSPSSLSISPTVSSYSSSPVRTSNITVTSPGGSEQSDAKKVNTDSIPAPPLPASTSQGANPFQINSPTTPHKKTLAPCKSITKPLGVDIEQAYSPQNYPQMSQSYSGGIGMNMSSPYSVKTNGPDVSMSVKANYNQSSNKYQNPYYSPSQNQYGQGGSQQQSFSNPGSLEYLGGSLTSDHARFKQWSDTHMPGMADMSIALKYRKDADIETKTELSPLQDSYMKQRAYEYASNSTNNNSGMLNLRESEGGSGGSSGNRSRSESENVDTRSRASSDDMMFGISMSPPTNNTIGMGGYVGNSQTVNNGNSNSNGNAHLTGAMKPPHSPPQNLLRNGNGVGSQGAYSPSQGYAHSINVGNCVNNSSAVQYQQPLVTSPASSVSTFLQDPSNKFQGSAEMFQTVAANTAATNVQVSGSLSPTTGMQGNSNIRRRSNSNTSLSSLVQAIHEKSPSRRNSGTVQGSGNGSGIGIAARNGPITDENHGSNSKITAYQKKSSSLIHASNHTSNDERSNEDDKLPVPPPLGLNLPHPPNVLTSNRVDKKVDTDPANE